MGAQSDFHYCVDRAAGLTLDATCAARVAGIGPVPPAHRERLRGAIRALERAQQHLFLARNLPWDMPEPRQMELLP